MYLVALSLTILLCILLITLLMIVVMALSTYRRYINNCICLSIYLCAINDISYLYE